MGNISKFNNMFLYPLLLVVAFCAYGLKFAMPLIVLIVMISYIPLRSRHLFQMISTLVSVVLFNSMFTTLEFGNIWVENDVKIVTSLIFGNDLSFIQLIFLNVICLMFIYLIYIKFFRWLKIDGVEYSVLPIILLVGIYVISSEAPLIRKLTLCLICFIAKSFWYINYFLISSFGKKNYNLISDLASVVQPVWSIGTVRSHCVPGDNDYVNSNQALDDFEYIKIRNSGLKLIYISIFFKYLSLFLMAIVFTGKMKLPYLDIWELFSFSLPNPQFIGFENYINSGVGFVELMAVSLLNALLYILKEPVADGGFLVGVIRLFGIRALLNVDKPYKAISFNDFYQRTYYYYNLILVKFFFIPIYTKMSCLFISKKIKMFCSVFLSVYLGGLLLNYLRQDIWLGALGPIYSWDLVTGRSFYLMGVAFFSALSIAFKLELSLEAQKSIYKRIMAIAIILIIYSFFFNLQGNLFLDNNDSRIKFLQYYLKEFIVFMRLN